MQPFSFRVHLVSQFGSTVFKECDEEYVLQNNAIFLTDKTDRHTTPIFKILRILKHFGGFH